MPPKRRARYEEADDAPLARPRYQDDPGAGPANAPPSQEEARRERAQREADEGRRIRGPQTAQGIDREQAAARRVANRAQQAEFSRQTTGLLVDILDHLITSKKGRNAPMPGARSGKERVAARKRSRRQHRRTAGAPPTAGGRVPLISQPNAQG